MTSPIEAKARQKAYDIIETYGRTMTFTTVASTYDPATGGTTQIEANYTIKGTPPMSRNAWKPGDLIYEGDCKTEIPVLDLAFTPHLGMKVAFNSRTFTVVRLDPEPSGELDALHVLFLKEITNG